MNPVRRILPILPVLPLPLLLACGDAAVRQGAWSGTMDTLPSGQVVVDNGDSRGWEEGEGWRVVEELRIGSATGEGPATFGTITSFAVDDAGRIWVVDGQAAEVRVFGSDGEHVRTVGRKGGGPGEFEQPVRIDRAPDGRMWVMDPRNARLSILDTAGTYVEGRQTAGGFVILPWPGGFDRSGRYLAPVPLRGGEGFQVGMARFDTAFQPLDTLSLRLEDPVERPSFRIEDDEGRSRVIASVPFSGGLRTVRAPDGTAWGLVTDQYRLFQLDPDGDTLRTITRDYEPLPVTGEDIDQAIEDLEWFTSQGGKIDPSRFPDAKPAARDFFIDDTGHIWVARVTAPELENRRFDIFDPDGRFLGSLDLPFALSTSPDPRFRGGNMYGVVRDELEVPYLVRARVDRGGGEPGEVAGGG